MNHSNIENPTPLQPNYVPPEFPHRGEETARLKAAIINKSSPGHQTLFVHGPRGTGKTHLLLSLLNECPDSVVTCYVPCHQYNTQYKALKQIYQAVTNDEPGDGHHTAALQRTIENRTQAVNVVVVLDELEFILHNDGDDLLYFLSRLDTDLTLILISATLNDLTSRLEERTYSSLQPQRIKFEPYTAEQCYDILVERARKALAPQSVHRQALTHIASTTQNLTAGLHWLRTAAKTAHGIITKHHAKEIQTQAYQNHVEHLLTDFSDHHSRLYQAIHELTQEQEKSGIRTGEIYQRHQDLCDTYNEESLSNRRLSDYLKHLEHLNLIKANYHYGGTKGKTREIQLPRF